MNTANSESDINNYLHQGQTDYISYNSIYNEVLDKVKKGLESQRSSSSILKKNSKKNNSDDYSKNDENVHPEDIALFQDDDSDDSDSDDFLEWENSDNESVYNSRFRGGLTRAKSHINDINDYNNTNKPSTDHNLDIVKDRIVLNKHFQKIYGFNDSSFRHGDYEMNNNHDEDDSDNESVSESEEKESLDNKEHEHEMVKEEETPVTEKITEEESPIKTVTEEITVDTTDNTETKDHSNESKDDLEKQFYNELRKASMIIDLQQHYRLRDGVKNKEDLKQEIVEGYNSLHNKNYSSEDLPDFQNIDNLEEVEAKVIEPTKDTNNSSTHTMNPTLSLLTDINEATKNTDVPEAEVEAEEDADEHDNNQLINDTWKFLFNNQYSLQFLSKSLKSSREKLSIHDVIKNKDTKSTLMTESTLTKTTEEDHKKTEPEASTSSSNHSKFELNNSLMSNILQHNLKNEEKLMKDREEEEVLRKNKENDWLSFVQKELASMNLSSTPSSSSHNTKKEIDKDKKTDYSKFIPNKIPTAPKFEFTIHEDETQ